MSQKFQKPPYSYFLLTGGSLFHSLSLSISLSIYLSRLSIYLSIYIYMCVCVPYCRRVHMTPRFTDIQDQFKCLVVNSSQDDTNVAAMLLLKQPPHKLRSVSGPKEQQSHPCQDKPPLCTTGLLDDRTACLGAGSSRTLIILSLGFNPDYMVRRYSRVPCWMGPHPAGARLLETARWTLVQLQGPTEVPAAGDSQLDLGPTEICQPSKGNPCFCRWPPPRTETWGQTL